MTAQTIRDFLELESSSGLLLVGAMLLVLLLQIIGWGESHGIVVLCGIGFTMSLFVATLSLGDASPVASDAAQLSAGGKWMTR